jgi:hypothetical protein
MTDKGTVQGMIYTVSIADNTLRSISGARETFSMSFMKQPWLSATNLTVEFLDIICYHGTGDRLCLTRYPMNNQGAFNAI